MALAMGIHKGKDIFIGDVQVKILTIVNPLKFEVIVKAPGNPIRYMISDEEGTEILPNVRLSAGLGGSMELIRVLIDAPKTLKVLRGHIYRREARGCIPLTVSPLAMMP